MCCMSPVPGDPKKNDLFVCCNLSFCLWTFVNKSNKIFSKKGIYTQWYNIRATDIAPYRLNWPRGRFSDNCPSALSHINLNFLIFNQFGVRFGKPVSRWHSPCSRDKLPTRCRLRNRTVQHRLHLTLQDCWHISVGGSRYSRLSSGTLRWSCPGHSQGCSDRWSRIPVWL